MPKKIILVEGGKEKFEAYGSLTQVCSEYPLLKYWTISRLKFPIESEGIKMHKIKYNKKSNKKK
jgi:hypothetical protein